MNKDILEQLIEKNLSQHEIAKVLNLGQTTVRYWLVKLDLKTKTNQYNKGGKNKTKLTPFPKCPYCDSELKKVSQKSFCSVKCQQALRHKNNVNAALMSGTFLGVVRKDSTIKIILLELRGHRCQICSLTEWLGEPIPLVMDHINGNGHDNRLENLRLVCGNCDMKLPTYKSKNIGKGRPEQSLYYSKVRAANALPPL